MRFLTWETGQWTRQSSTVFEVELQTPNTHTHTRMQCVFRVVLLVCLSRACLGN
jgi:hypothetical protein